jgi:hypothetical protein
MVEDSMDLLVVRAETATLIVLQGILKMVHPGACRHGPTQDWLAAALGAVAAALALSVGSLIPYTAETVVQAETGSRLGQHFQPAQTPPL